MAETTGDERRYAIDVQVDLRYADRVPVDELVQVAERVLARVESEPSAGRPLGTALTLVITDDETVRALNRAFRGEDSATDVLSFAASEAEPSALGTGPAFVSPEEEPPYLGDVIISFPTALAQAEVEGHPVEDELRLLVAHGCLHLLGYDHSTPEEEKAMWALQAEILADRGLPSARGEGTLEPQRPQRPLR